MENIIHRGDIFFVDLDSVGYETRGAHPVVVIQNNIGNYHSHTVIVAIITSNIHKKRLPTHVNIFARQTGLPKDSLIMTEQIRTIDKSRLGRIAGRLDNFALQELNTAIAISLGL